MRHEVTWTPEHIQRFWDAYASNPRRLDTYFSKLYGPAILRVARHYARLSSPIVDVGCGQGALLDALLAQGFSCQGVDASEVSVGNVEARFRARPGFLGALTGSVDRLPLPEAEAGAAFLVEVVEHLDRSTLERALGELHRVLRPGGHLLVTVPNNEDLQAAMVACPECGCVFHRMQHVRSFTPDALAAELRRARFEIVKVLETDFASVGRSGLARLAALGRRVQQRWRPQPQPHLMAIARRPS